MRESMAIYCRRYLQCLQTLSKLHFVAKRSAPVFSSKVLGCADLTMSISEHVHLVARGPRRETLPRVQGVQKCTKVCRTFIFQDNRIFQARPFDVFGVRWRQRKYIEEGILWFRRVEEGQFGHAEQRIFHLRKNSATEITCKMVEHTLNTTSSKLKNGSKIAAAGCSTSLLSGPGLRPELSTVGSFSVPSP